MNALKKIAGAPLLLFGVWLGTMLIGWGLGAIVTTVTAAAVGPFDPLMRDHPIVATVELMAGEPAVPAALGLAVVSSSILGIVGWTLLSGGVLARLEGHRGEALGGIWARSLPGVIVTSLWHLLVRAALLVVLASITAPLVPSARIPLLALGLALAGVALDVARAQVVLHGAAPYHVRTAFCAFIQVLKRPKLLASAGALWLAQAFVAAAILYLGLRGLDGALGTWPPRALALAGVFLGLWRLAVVVGWGRIDLGLGLGSGRSTE